MRICRITKRAHPRIGGLENHVQTMSEIQTRDGHEVTVFTLLGDAHPADGDGFEVRRVPGGALARLLRREIFVSLINAIGALVAVSRAHCRRRFDVIHLHGDYTEAFLGGVLSKLLGVPSVITVHAGLNRNRFYQGIAGFGWRRVAGVMAHSEDIKQELIDLGVDPGRVTVSHTAMWFDRFVRPDGGVPPDAEKLTVVSVGRLDPMKGYEYLVDAATTVASRRPCRVVVAGEGPLRHDLEERARKAGSPIEFIGQVANDKVPELLWGAHVYVQPSVSLPGQREATTVTVQEAMAAGLPVVATPSGGMRQLVQDGVDGYVVPERDATALADRIVDLVDDAAARARIGRSNVEKARGYDWSHVARQVAERYVLAGAKG